MSTKRKKGSSNPRAAALAKARREHAKANRLAQRNPSHENLTRAFALAHVVKLAEGMLGK